MLFLTLASAAMLAASPAVPVCNNANTTTSPHFAAATSAMIKGDVATARREFRIAEAIGRDSGCLPVAASQGLAQLFFGQQQLLEAADVLQHLADDAARAGDIDLEARTLVDVTWLQLKAGDREMAKHSGRRLYQLSRDARLSSDTRAFLRTSLR